MSTNGVKGPSKAEEDKREAAEADEKYEAERCQKIEAHNRKIDAWKEKLMGKKLSDTPSDTTFTRADLPEEHFIIGPNILRNLDEFFCIFKHDRVRVYLDKNDVVIDVDLK